MSYDLHADDVTALRAELTSVRARQEVLADALAAATEELEHLVAAFNEIRTQAEAALRHLDLDYDEGSRIDRAVQSIERILEITP